MYAVHFYGFGVLIEADSKNFLYEIKFKSEVHFKNLRIEI